MRPIVFAAPIAMLLSLAGCGNGMAGTYTCDDSGPIDAIQLESGGKLVASSSMFGEMQQRIGTWEKSGDGLVGTIGGQSTPIGIDGKDLTLMGGRCVRQ